MGAGSASRLFPGGGGGVPFLPRFFCGSLPGCGAARFAQVFGAGARSHPPVCALAARSRRSRSLRSRLPEGRGYAPLPRTPTRGKLSLQAFLLRAFARPAALRAGFLCSRM